MTPGLYMDVVITPNRSLSKRGFYWLIGVLVAFNLAIAVLFVALGALPVPIFLGLDVLGVWLAFRASYGGAGQSERLQVTADEVRVIHQAGRAARTVWTSPTAFTRVSLDRTDNRIAWVRLRLSDRRLTVGSALGGPDRAALAETLDRAIREARAERWSSRQPS
jgi:uncharacterized membrane protein